jgi:ribosomal protein S18 acetylase RimI-like enzyme
MTSAITVRPARPDEYAAAGELTVRAYRVDGFLGDVGSATDGHAAELADVAGRARSAAVLVAVDDRGVVVGTATLVSDATSPYLELAGEDDAELRMLAVEPKLQGAGIGRALVEECIALAARSGRRRIVLSSRPDMTSAHRLYARLGFARAPELDWEPVPDLRLVAFVYDVEGGGP